MRKMLLATLVLVLCMVTCNALAESGTCGDNLTWTLEDGVLTISGTGDMYDDAFYNVINRWAVSHIVINDGVTSIGVSAFSPWYNLQSVLLPESVTKIGAYAFSDCDQLAIVHFPSQLTQICDYAFRGCKLETIELPESITLIGALAFEGNPISRVHLPAALTVLGEGDPCYTSLHGDRGNPFARCNNLADISVSDSNTAFVVKDGVLFTSDMETLLCYPGGKDDLTVYTIPDTVSKIDGHAFSGNEILTETTFHEGVIDIGVYAFEYSYLSTLELPAELERLGVNAFIDCDQLETVTVRGKSEWQGYCGSFRDCHSLKEVVIEEGFTSIGEQAFSMCGALERVTLPTTLTSIERLAFCWTGLQEIVFPKSVTEIGSEAFLLCESLEKAFFTGDAPEEDTTAFTSVHEDFCIYYPEGASGWSTPTWHGYKAVPYKLENDTSNVSGTFKYAGMMNNKVDAEAEYYYRDDYFRSSSEVYNPSLATMSLCLELSTWSSYEEKVWANKTKNVRALLDEIGFEAYAQNDLWSSAPTTNSIGVVAARKQIDDSTLIALVVRGGGYGDEWGGNFLVGEKNVHEGFAIARDQVLKFLKSYIKEQQITGRIKLWIVGYSRGGAVANMVGCYLNHMDVYEKMSMFPDGKLATSDMYCYTFEAPQGTIKLNSSYKDLNIHNIVNANDVVTLLAPSGWGFVRANTNSHFLPTIATKNFTYMQKSMLQQYEEILKGVEEDPAEAKYNISEYAKRLDYKIVWKVKNPLLNKLPEPQVEIVFKDDKEKTQAEVLNNLFDTLTRYLSRAEYVRIQEDFSYLVAELMTGGMSANEMVSQFGTALTANDYENLIYLLEPLAELSFRPVSERFEQVRPRCVFVLADILDQYDLPNSRLVVDILAEVLAEIIVKEPEVLLDAVLSFAGSSPIQAHYPEITLAWLRIEDPNYVADPWTADIPEVGRVVRIKCPVDIRVYDSQNQLVASVINGVCYSADAAIGCAIEEDGAKILHLPSDEDYQIQVKATGDGVVNYTVSEYNAADSTVTRVLSYFDVDVQTGEHLVGVVPVLAKDDYQDEELQGSDAYYRLLTIDGKEVKTPESHRGTAVANHFVTVMANNEHGAVLGGGSYLYGTFAQVEAIPTEQSSFLGWYINGQLVSTDTVYNFVVYEDTALTAHFKEVPNGDADANSEIDVYDALRILQYLAGWDVEIDTFNADANADGIVTIDDALLTLEYCFDGDMPKAVRALQAMLRSMSINPLQIEKRPTDQYAVIGQRAQFAVAATGDGLTYQWYINCNDGKGWLALTNATRATWVTSAVALSNDGHQYRCVVTDVYGNEITSDAAVLHVVLELPNTGDGADPALWLVMVMLSAISMTFMFKRRIIR